MWNPPLALPPAEQPIAARTRKTRKFFVLLREHRHELRDADFQNLLAHSSSPALGGHEPVEAGLWALAPLLQAYSNGSDRDAGELTVMDKRWQMGLDGLGAEQPPFSQGTLCHCRLRLSAHNVDKTWLDRTVALAEKTGGVGTRPLRAALDSTPLFGAGWGEATLNLLGHALRKAGGLAAPELDPAAAAVMEAAGLTWGGHSRLKAALDLDGGEPRARACALGLGLDEGARWLQWLEPQPTPAAQAPPLQEVRDTIPQMITQDTAPDPAGGPGGRRLTPPVAPERRISIAAPAMRHGRKSSANTFHGFQEHGGVALDSQVLRAGVVRPANAPAQAAVDRLAPELEHAPGLLQLDIDRGYMARPRIRQWAAPGVYIIARPWPCGGRLFTKQAVTFDCAHGRVTWPGGQTVPLPPGSPGAFPARACDPCPQRAQCPTATLGPGRPLTIREEAQGPQQLRATLRTKRGRAALRKRPAVEHAMAHPVAHQGRRAR